MYAKLFSRITESSLMEESVPVRYVFMMLLAIADPEGIVVGTDVALSRRLNIPTGEFVRCIEELGAPDPNSNSQEKEGRRVVKSEGERGYEVVNYRAYRGLRDEAERREYMREYMQEYRKKQTVNSVNSRKHRKPQLAHADAEAEAEAEADTEEGGATAPASPSVGVDDLVEAWNRKPGMPHVQQITPKRKVAAKARLGEDFFRANWAEAINRIAASPFCIGDNNRGWRADFDWFLKPATVVSVMEGKYSNCNGSSREPAEHSDDKW